MGPQFLDRGIRWSLRSHHGRLWKFVFVFLRIPTGFERLIFTRALRSFMALLGIPRIAVTASELGNC